MDLTVVVQTQHQCGDKVVKTAEVEIPPTASLIIGGLKQKALALALQAMVNATSNRVSNVNQG